MAYSPPAFNAVDFDFTTSYSAPTYTDVDFDFTDNSGGAILIGGRLVGGSLLMRGLAR